MRGGLRAAALDGCCGFSRQLFQLTRAQITLSQLDEVHTGARRLLNAFQQKRTARLFVASQLYAVGDAVEQERRWSLVFGRWRIGRACLALVATVHQLSSEMRDSTLRDDS